LEIPLLFFFLKADHSSAKMQSFLMFSDFVFYSYLFIYIVFAENVQMYRKKEIQYVQLTNTLNSNIKVLLTLILL